MTSKKHRHERHVPRFLTTPTQPRPLPAAVRISTPEMSKIVEDDKALRELMAMHKYMRPACSTAEREFNERFLLSMPGTSEDAYGNIYAAVGENPTVLWSSHTDTVHRNSGRQRLTLRAQFLRVHSDDKASTCLGADCTVGVWLMRQMYLARIPGLYIWHAEEEIGGGGSQYIATKSRDMLDGIQAAIAFDRKGLDSVITHQFSSRTASDTFANSLAQFLGGRYAPDTGGTFTDTANYEHIVPECTNVSVGYYYAHTSDEALDLLHAQSLLAKMLTFDASVLKIARDPTVRPASNYKTFTNDDWDTYMRAWSKETKGWESALDDDFRDSAITLYDVVKTHPRDVADMLARYNITADELMSDAGILASDVKSRRGRH